MPFVIPAAGALIAGGAAAASASGGGGSGGGKKAPKQRGGFSTPAFSGFFTGKKKNKRFNLERGEETTGLLADLRGRLGDSTSALRSLREQVAPGFGDLTQQRVQAIRDAGSRTTGNLREELGRRRVAGSSFAEREIASTEAMFAREEERARTEAKVQEIAMTDQLIQQEFQNAFATINTLIEQGNFEASLAANVQASNENLKQQRAMANDQISQANAGGWMELIGTAISAYAIYSSDRRLKKNIERIGTVKGYPWYSFEFIDSGDKSVGFMSDEVDSRFVVQDENGYDMVNYGAILGGCYAED